MRRIFFSVICFLALLGLMGCGGSAEQQPAKAAEKTADKKDAVTLLKEKYKLKHLVAEGQGARVYFTKDISPEGLMKIYAALGQKAEGKVGIKISFETPDGPYINPKLLKPLRDKVNGTFMDSNGFTPPRHTTDGHLQVARDHGFMDVGPVDILDAEDELDMPVDGKYLKFHRTGSHFNDYGTLISIVKFKPHYLPVYGGTTKNLTICLGSIAGKANIHSAGRTVNGYRPADKEEQMEAFAEAVEAAVNYKKDRWVYINILSDMKYKDSCPDIHDLDDVGILASADPVAVDQAAMDFTYGQAASDELRAQWEEYHWADILALAEKRGAGRRVYSLQVVE